MRSLSDSDELTSEDCKVRASKFADLFPITDYRTSIGRDDTPPSMSRAVTYTPREIECDLPISSGTMDQLIELMSLESFMRSLPTLVPVYADIDSSDD